MVVQLTVWKLNKKWSVKLEIVCPKCRKHTRRRTNIMSTRESFFCEHKFMRKPVIHLCRLPNECFGSAMLWCFGLGESRQRINPISGFPQLRLHLIRVSRANNLNTTSTENQQRSWKQQIDKAVHQEVFTFPDGSVSLRKLSEPWKKKPKKKRGYQ